jgi:outer membrane receptor protein involved in Fe transport
VATYTNYVTNLIVLGGQGTAQSPNQYVNSTSPIETTGAEAEVRREWRDGWMVGASYAYQRSHYLDDAPVGGPAPLRDVPNSPNHLPSLKAAAPIVGSLLNAMTRLSFVGPGGTSTTSRRIRRRVRRPRPFCGTSCSRGRPSGTGFATRSGSSTP